MTIKVASVSGTSFHSAAQPTNAAQAWRKGPRKATGAPVFEDLVKPDVKKLEAEVRKQFQLHHRRCQEDLDLLHDQVHNEVYAAISQELGAVARSIKSSIDNVKAEALEDARNGLSREVAPLRGGLRQLQEEVAKVSAARQDGDGESEASKQAAAAARQASEELLAELREVVGNLSETVTNTEAELRKDAASIRAEVAVVDQRLCQDFSSKLKQLENGIVEGLEAEVGERMQLTTVLENSRTEAKESLEHLTAELEKIRSFVNAEAGTADSRHREAIQATGTALASLEQRLSEVAQSASERAEKTKENVDSLVEGKLQTMTGVTDIRHSAMEEQVNSLKKTCSTRLVQAEKELDRLGKECRDGLRFASAAWARTVEWSAKVDTAQLHHDGRLELSSPSFDAAGLRGLQLQLRIDAAKSGRQAPLDSTSAAGQDGRRWVCGAFLLAKEGQVSFRLHVGGRAQTFTAAFGDSPEWGSQRIAVLDQFEDDAGLLTVKLEILDVVTATESHDGATDLLPEGLKASTQIVDAAMVASREVAALRSQSVRKIEWRVARVSERFNHAKKAAEAKVTDEEALEPICSPPFAAAGVEGMQLQLYPAGRKVGSRGDGQCGFFLVCPRGVFVKCRAFVGDQVRVFEHQFDSREPYGKSSFCRLEERIDADDSVICGIEILELRLENTMQVRGGAFGNVADQLKLTMNPNMNSMDLVRELREQDGASKEHQRRHRHGGGYHRSSTITQDWSATVGQYAPPPQQSVLASSKSLPTLVPPFVAAASTTTGSAWPHGAAGMTKFGKVLPKM